MAPPLAGGLTPATNTDGRLRLDELDQRLEDMLSARTLRDIARVIADLPGPRPQVTEPVTPPAETRWTLLQSLVA